MGKVRLGHFSGNGRVYSANPDGLADIVRTMLGIHGSDAAIAAAAADFSIADSSTAVGRTVVVGDATGGTVENQFTLSSGVLGVPTGHPVVFQGSDLPAGITAGTTYYVIRVKVSGVVSPTIFQVAETVLDAELGSAAALTDDGTGTQWIQRQMGLPAPLETHDSLGGTTGLLDTQMAATGDTIMETLASVVNVLAGVGTSVGITTPTVGTLTGAVDTVAAIDVTATANTSDDDAALFDDVKVAEAEINDAIATVTNYVNDVSAAVGRDEFVGFISRIGDAGAGIDAVTAATSPVGSAATTVALTDWNAALVVWRQAVGHLLQSVSVVSADAQGTAPEDYTHQLVPSATEVPVLGLGGITRR